jgi:D-3-phosphoglycerate dehydrogenase / 2-oxoglutarate reductase
MPRVLIAPREVAAFAHRYSDVFARAGIEMVEPPPGPANILTPAELLDCLDGIDATVAGSEPYTAELFAARPQLKIVARVGVGYDAIDVPAATAAGVAVCTAPGTNHECVAEHTLALLLAFTRHIVSRSTLIRHGGWPRHYSLPLRGRTLGLLGLGRIGKAVAVRAAAFGMKIIAHDPIPFRHDNIISVPFHDLLARSDVLSLHLPLTPATRNILNAAAFAQLKPGAILINTSRGGLIDEAALVESLRTGRLAGAGLDVLQEEPPPAQHPLFAFENVLFTPHAAGVDLQSLGDMARSAAEAIADILTGQWPTEKVVNPEVQPRREVRRVE